MDRTTVPPVSWIFKSQPNKEHRGLWPGFHLELPLIEHYANSMGPRQLLIHREALRATAACLTWLHESNGVNVLRCLYSRTSAAASLSAELVSIPKGDNSSLAKLTSSHPHTSHPSCPAASTHRTSRLPKSPNSRPKDDGSACSHA